MRAPYKYEILEVSPDELAHERDVFGTLADAVRDLSEASLQTLIDESEVRAITTEVEALTARLRSKQLHGAYGVALTPGGLTLNHGNAVVGMRNPIAPPVHIHRGGDGHTWADFHLNALYEGPPGLVHGGVVALILDQMLGECAADGGGPGMTGTLSIRYQRPTHLGDCSAEAWVTEIGETKTFVRGVIRDASGQETAEATGIFILPRWVRAKGAADQPSSWG